MPLLGPRSHAALARFEADPLVQDVEVSWDRLRVRYSSGTRECWWMDHGGSRGLTFPRSGWWEYEPPILPEGGDLVYEPDPDGPMWSVPASEIRKAGYLDQRLLIQRVLVRLLREGWIQPVQRDAWLDMDLERLQKATTHGHVITRGYVRQQVARSHRPPPGFAVAASMSDWTDVRDGSRETLRSSHERPDRPYWAVREAVERGRDLNRLSLLHTMTSGSARGLATKAGPRLVPPIFLKAILKDLCGHGKPIVKALYACPGFAAAATVALGGIYLHASAWPINEMIIPWAARHGALVEEDDDACADIGLLGDLGAVTYEHLEQAMEDAYPTCAMVVAFTKRPHAVQFRERHNRVEVIRFHRWAFMKEDSAILLWRQG